MIRDYVKTKRVRAALSIENDMMLRVPEVNSCVFYALFEVRR